ncbi:MAG TPA: sigma-70 family RNA polymerase sigma factor [Alphaproteobacteria bacterium]|jgi:RNA polymerase sigma-70 factor (ECF subfamily)
MGALDSNLKDQILSQIPRLRRFARYLARDADHADDLVQETLIRALASLPQLDPEGNLRAWLFTILQNVLRGEWRRRRRSPVRLEVPLASAPEPVKSGGQLETASLAELAAAIRKMPPRFREVLLLCGVEGFDYEEAAAVLGVPVGTVRSRLSRARAMLKEWSPE